MPLISALARWLHPPAPDSARQRALVRAAEAVDPLLKTVGGYERKLIPGVEAACDYCERLITGIPGPMAVGVRAFGDDPLVHAIFGSADDIGLMIGASEAVRGYMADGSHALDREFFGLLGMRRFEKKITGMALRDGFVRNEVPQRLLYFADHTLSCTSPDADAARTGLRAAAFDSLVGSFAAQVDARRQQRQDLRTAIDVARARKQDCGELNEQLRALNGQLEPQRLLAEFSEWLGNPAEHLRLQPNSVCVDRMGVIMDETAPPADARVLDFPELVGRDRRHWLVLLARLSREEAKEAIAQREKAHRYIVI